MEDYNLESKIMIPEKKGNFWGNIITFCLLFLSITIPKIVSAIYPRLDYEGAALQIMKSSLIPSFGIFLLLAYFSFFYKKPLRYIFLFLFGVIATIGLIFSMRGALGSLSAVLALSDERLNIEARYFSKEIYLVGTFFFLLLGILILSVLPIRRRSELSLKKIIIFFAPLITLLIIVVVFYIVLIMIVFIS